MKLSFIQIHLWNGLLYNEVDLSQMPQQTNF